MTLAGSGYIALPQDEVSELAKMAPRAPPPPPTTTVSGLWRRSDVDQLPVSFSSDLELDELMSASTTTTWTAASPPPAPPLQLISHDQSELPPSLPPPPPPPAPPPAGSSPPLKFQVENLSYVPSATSHVKRRLE